MWDNLLDAELRAKPNTSVSFAELIDASVCRRALLSSMIMDPTWVAKYVHGIPRVCVVKDADHDPRADPRTGGSVVIGRTVWVSPPQPVLENNSYSLMHVKLHLFELGADRLRVVITSANGLKAEWQAMGNCVWFQDFPRRTEADNAAGRAFRGTLYRLFDLWRHVPAEFGAAWLDQFSFNTAQGTLVLSAPGVWTGDEASLYGMNALRSAVCGLNPAPSEELPLDDTNALELQAAHLGYLTRKWFDGQFLRAALAPPDGRALPRRNALVSVVYPTAARAIAMAGASGLDNLIGLQSNTIPPDFALGELFPLVDFADFDAHRGVPYHSKVITRLWGDDKGWTYTGSHNLTAAAWGSYRGNAILIRNFELGIVLPRPCAYVTNHGRPPHVPLQMQWRRPLARYRAGERPWLCNQAPSELQAAMSMANQLIEAGLDDTKLQ